MSELLHTELVSPAGLTPHPKNYRTHSAAQVDHICASIQTHGMYRNVVIAQDGTILAGHGVVAACVKLGMPSIAVVRLPIGPDDVRALQVLAGDNEISNLADVDDRQLSEILKSIADIDVENLMGTGYDQSQLAALTYVTRHRSEIPTMNAAAAWAGLPEYEEGEPPIKLVVNFKSFEDRERFRVETGIQMDSAKPDGRTWSTRWPWTDHEAMADFRFIQGAEEQ